MNTPDPSSFLPVPHLPFHILLGLSHGEPMHGWGVIKRIEEITGGRTCPSTGSLYLALGRLAERGLLEPVEAPSEAEDRRRRYYRLSGLGRRVLEAEAQRLGSLVDLARAASGTTGHG